MFCLNILVKFRIIYLTENSSLYSSTDITKDSDYYNTLETLLVVGLLSCCLEVNLLTRMYELAAVLTMQRRKLDTQVNKKFRHLDMKRSWPNFMHHSEHLSRGSDHKHENIG